MLTTLAQTDPPLPLFPLLQSSHMMDHPGNSTDPLLYLFLLVAVFFLAVGLFTLAVLVWLVRKPREERLGGTKVNNGGESEPQSPLDDGSTGSFDHQPNESAPQTNPSQAEGQVVVPNLSYSIDEQAYQRKRMLAVLQDFPEGLLQSKLPSLLNMSKATISRRVQELEEDGVIQRVPKGRSLLVRLV